MSRVHYTEEKELCQARRNAEGRFASQIVPVSVKDEDGTTSSFEKDEGIRTDTSLEKLANTDEDRGELAQPVFGQQRRLFVFTSVMHVHLPFSKKRLYGLPVAFCQRNLLCQIGTMPIRVLRNQECDGRGRTTLME